MPDIVSKFLCVLPSEVAVLFYLNLNLSRRPFLGQVAFHLQLIWLQTLVAIDTETWQCHVKHAIHSFQALA